MCERSKFDRWYKSIDTRMLARMFNAIHIDDILPRWVVTKSQTD